MVFIKYSVSSNSDSVSSHNPAFSMILRGIRKIPGLVIALAFRHEAHAQSLDDMVCQQGSGLSLKVLTSSFRKRPHCADMILLSSVAKAPWFAIIFGSMK